MLPSRYKIFMSHAATDHELVALLKRYLEQNWFKNLVKVFAASVPGDIPSGERWLDQIRASLAEASTCIFLLTPTSITRRWLWFEMGAAWERYESHQTIILPLWYKIPEAELPSPISNVQGHALSNIERMQHWLNTLAAQLQSHPISHKSVAGFVTKLAGLQVPSVPHIPSAYQDQLRQALEDLAEGSFIESSSLSKFEGLLPAAHIADLKKRARQAARRA